MSSDLRLECLRLASMRSESAGDVVDLARKYEAYVNNGAAPYSEGGPTPESETDAAARDRYLKAYRDIPKEREPVTSLSGNPIPLTDGPLTNRDPNIYADT